MTEPSMVCAGIDISKVRLDVALFPAGERLCVAYDAAGLTALDAFLDRHGVGRVGFEASGGYEWRLLAHLRRTDRGGAAAAGTGARLRQKPLAEGQERPSASSGGSTRR